MPRKSTAVPTCDPRRRRRPRRRRQRHQHGHARSRSSIGGSRTVRRQYVCVTGVHGVMESQRDERLRQIHNAAGLVTPDGMPLVWLSRSARLAPHEPRLRSGPDAGAAASARSPPAIATSSTAAARALPSGWRSGCSGGFPAWRSPARTRRRSVRSRRTKTTRSSARINDAKPDIVWVGLSTPKQEHWMAAARRPARRRRC